MTLRDTHCLGVPMVVVSGHGWMPMAASRDLSGAEVLAENSDMGGDGISLTYHYVSASNSLDIHFEDPFPDERDFYFQWFMDQWAPDHSEAKREKYFLSLAKDCGRASPAWKRPRKYL